MFQQIKPAVFLMRPEEREIGIRSRLFYDFLSPKNCVKINAAAILYSFICTLLLFYQFTKNFAASKIFAFPALAPAQKRLDIFHPGVSRIHPNSAQLPCGHNQIRQVSFCISNGQLKTGKAGLSAGETPP
ncbi:MAG: hypothetical protein ACI3VZ_07590 [Faecousia sp.]